jgi:hypothetical protein
MIKEIFLFSDISKILKTELPWYNKVNTTLNGKKRGYTAQHSS